MSAWSNISDGFSFPVGWKLVLYILVCVGFIVVYPMFGIASNIFPMILVGVTFMLLCLAVIFYDLQAGFYGLIIFGFLMASLDRLTNSTLPLYSVLYGTPVLLFMGVLVKKSFTKETIKVEKHPLLLGYLVLLGYSIIQVFNPNMFSILGWVSFLRQELSMLLLLFVCFYLFRDLKTIRFFFKFLFGAIFITALYGIIQEKFGLTPWDKRWVYGNPDVLRLYSLYGLGLRKFSFLTDPANFGVLTAAGGVGTLILALESKVKKTRMLLFFFTAIIFWSMSYSGTRTANLMAVAGLGLYVLMTLYRKRTWIFAGFFALVFAFILYAPIYGNVTLFRLRTSFQAPTKDKSLEVRTINRALMHPYIMEHPFGGGVNTTAGGGLTYNPHHYLAGFPPDSSLFATALEQGSVGLALHLSFLFLLLFYGIHYFYRSRNNEIKTYYAIMVTMLFSIGLIGAYAQFTLKNVPQFFIYIAFIVIIIRLHTIENADTNHLGKKFKI